MSMADSLALLRTQINSTFRRVLNYVGVNENDSENDTAESRLQNYLNRIFGGKLRYVLFGCVLSLISLIAIISQGNEHYNYAPSSPYLMKAKISPTENLRERLDKFNISDKDFHIINSTMHNLEKSIRASRTNATLSIQRTNKLRQERNASASSSFWLSMMLSFSAWMLVLQALRFLRGAGMIGSMFRTQSFTTRQRRSVAEIQMLTQLSRLAGSNIPGLSDRLRMALMNRDFDGNDYEMLQRLDDARFGGGGPRIRGATSEEINRLPLRILTSEDEIRGDESSQSSIYRDGRNHRTHEDNGFGTCNICLEPYSVGDEVRIVRCMHKFHKNCIDQWLTTNAICPICKFPSVE